MLRDEKRLHALLNSMRALLFTLDGELRVRAAYGQLLEPSAGGAAPYLGKSLREILGDAAAERHEIAARRALAGESVQYDWSCEESPDPQWWEVTMSPLRDVDGVVGGVAGVLYDVTARWRAAAGARADRTIAGTVAAISDVTGQRRSDEWQRLLVSAMDVGEVFITIRGADGALLHMNRAALALGGFASVEEAAQATIERLVGASADYFRQTIMAEVRRSGAWSGELAVHHHARNTELTVLCDVQAFRDAPGAPYTAYVSVARDITELKRAEQAIGDREHRFRMLFEHSPVGAALVSPTTGRFLAANESAARTLGYTREEFVRLRVEDLVEGGRREADEPQGDAPVTITTRQRAKDGTPRDILVTMQSLTMEGERLLYCVSVDVTALNESTTALRELTSALEARVAERTRELAEANAALALANQRTRDFLADMSHELRTPLNAILGLSELLVDGAVGEVNPSQRECLNDTISSARHLLQIVNDSLDRAKIEAGQLDLRVDRIDPVRVVEETMASLRHESARLGVELQLDSAGAPRAFHTDARRLKQIAYNLVGNALKYSPRGRAVRVQLTRDGDGLRLAVRDEGPGLSDDAQARLFVPFARLDASITAPHQGTGLGLAYTKRVAEALGGGVGVTSAPGAGSTFWVRLADRVPGARPTT